MNETFDPMGPKASKPGFTADELKNRHEFGNPTWEDVRREGQTAGRQAKAVAEKAREMADTARESFADLKHKAADRVDDLKHKAADRVDAVRTRSFRENAEAARDQIQKHPGTAVLLSMALGLMIGKSLAGGRKHRLAMK